MTRPSPSSRSGAFGLLFVFCLAALLAGLGFDLGAAARMHFWIANQPGAALAVGVAATLFTVLSALIARAVLGRKQSIEGGDARPHA